MTETSGRLKKIVLIADCLRGMDEGERAIGARYLAGEIPQKTNIGYATAGEVARTTPPAGEPQLTLREVDARLDDIAKLAGPGSAGARKAHLGEMLARATPEEQTFLARLAVGELRQGALEASSSRRSRRRRASRRLMCGARTCSRATSASSRRAALATARGPRHFGLQLFRPVLPMLAQTADDAGEALSAFGGPAALELKLDGFRVQLHKDGDDVRAYSRALNDVTAYVPEVVAAVRALPARRLILDGEAIVLGAERPAAAVPGHDEAVRQERRRAGRRAAADARGVRHAARRRPDAARRARRSERSTRSASSRPQLAVPRVITATPTRPRRSTARARARPRGRDGEGARRAVRRRQPRRARGSRSSRCTARSRRARGGVGQRAAARAGCRTSTSARAIRPAASSCSARRSRA